MPDPPLVSAFFDHRADAERAVAGVQALGLTPADISMVHTRDEGELPPTEEGPDYVRPGGWRGRGRGAGWARRARGWPHRPGDRRCDGGGGWGGGALAGALTHMGHMDEEARFYEEQVEQDRTLVTVWARSRSPQVRDLLAQHGGVLSDSHGQPLSQEAAPPADEVRARIPERIGTPGLPGQIDEGGQTKPAALAPALQGDPPPTTSSQ